MRAGAACRLGEPPFDGVENRLSQALYAIPAVKCVEFGAGAAVSRLRGSAHNDAFYYDEAGRVRTRTNRHGGVLGGMTTGMPLLLTCHIKPTPSIALPQESVNLQTHESARLCVPGRARSLRRAARRALRGSRRSHRAAGSVSGGLDRWHWMSCARGLTARIRN